MQSSGLNKLQNPLQRELKTIIIHISAIEGVDEVKRVSDDDMDIYSF